MVALLGLTSMITMMVGSASAQRYSLDKRTYFDFGEPFYCSLIQSADGRTADVLVNTSSALFSFLRTNTAQLRKHGEYYAIRDVTVELIDRASKDVILTHSSLDTIFVKSYDASISRDSWHTMHQALQMPNTSAERLGVRVTIRDGVLNRDVMRPVIADVHLGRYNPNATDSSGIALGELMLFDSLRSGSGMMAVHGNRFNFSRDIPGSVSFRLSPALAAQQPVVELTVRQVANEIYPRDTGIRAQMKLELSDLHPASMMTLSADRSAAGDSMVTFALAPSQDSDSWTAFFRVPGVSFEQGKYEFTARIIAGGAERTLAQNFQLTWQNMPLSLDDPADAVAPLVHILPAEKVAEITLGSKEQVRQKLYQYWKTQDPTPGTAYNERMAEFYRRVDYADFNFPVGRVLDGALTDRGKIYLLYGAPQSIDRQLLPGQAPTEYWTYANNVKRSFRFEDRIGGGHYELVDVENRASAK
jgi:GWxTD domain-containing protein